MRLTESQKAALRGGPPARLEEASGPLETVLQKLINTRGDEVRTDPDYRMGKKKMPVWARDSNRWDPDRPDAAEYESRMADEIAEAFDVALAAVNDYDRVIEPAIQAFISTLKAKATAVLGKHVLVTVDDLIDPLAEEEIPIALTDGWEKHFKTKVK